MEVITEVAAPRAAGIVRAGAGVMAWLTAVTAAQVRTAG